MHKISLAFALASVVAVPASAQSFNGPFVGVELGGTHDNVDSTSIDGVALGVGKSKNAASGGLFAGYDLQFGKSIVIGGELGINAGIKDHVRKLETGATTIVDPKYAIDLTGRAGVLLDPDTLFYARGGYEAMRVSSTQLGKDGANRGKATLQGWTAGVGVERALAFGISARVEYRYAELNKEDARLKKHQVMAGLSYRF